MKSTFFLILFLLTFSGFSLQAQEQAPPDKNKKEIETQHARIIFSRDIEKQARKAAFLIDSMYETQSRSLNAFPEKVPVLLYNKTVISNGYAALYPRRSAWYTTGMQDPSELGNADWLTLLSVHEFRHIVQYAKYNKHFTKFLSYLFGETGIVMGRYSVPYWFAEGDAIAAETAHTIGGRGRLPKFEMKHKSLFLAKDNPSYPKVKLGSYKNYYPNHYHLGWLMVSYARMKYGADVWDKTLDHAAKISFWPYAFSRGLKKHTGVSEKDLYNEAVNYYDSLWTTHNKQKDTIPAEIITSKEKVYTNYTEAEYTDKGEIIFLKSSLKAIKHFYITDAQGQTRKLFPTVTQRFSTQADKIVFSKTFFDKRYNYRSYSDIMVYDMNSQSKQRLTKKQKFFAPNLSPDGKKIALIENNEQVQSRLHVIDSENGRILKSFKNPDNCFLRTPVWSPEGNEIAYTAGSEKGLSLIVVDYETQTTDTIIDQSREVFGRPAFYKNYLLYNSSFGKTGNIYAVNRKTAEQYRLTSADYGAYNPKVKGDSMLYDCYTPKGYRTARRQLETEKWKNKNENAAYTSRRTKTIVQQEGNFQFTDFKMNKKNQYSVKKYRPLRDAVKIYGWGFYSDYESKISFSLYSNNLLNTLRGKANISYDVNEETFGSSLSVDFAKYYPIISLYGNYNQRYMNYESEGIEDYWDERGGGISLRLPLQLKTGVWNSRLDVSLSTGLMAVRNKKLRYPSEYGNGKFLKNKYSLFWYRQRRRAHRDLYPRFGTLLHLQYQHLPISDYRAEQFGLTARQYLPGLFTNHSLALGVGLEKQAKPENSFSDYYWFQSTLRFARGYDAQTFTDLYKLSADYRLPILYPDLSIGSLIYFKRLRGGIFGDYAQSISFEGAEKNYLSAGTELFLEFNLFNLEESFEIGGRASYLFDNQMPVFEFIMANIPF